MNARRSRWRRWLRTAAWATLITIAFAATAAARDDVVILNRPIVLVLAHDPSATPPPKLERLSTAGDNDAISPQIAVTNVGPPLHTLPSITISSGAQNLRLKVEVEDDDDDDDTSSTTSVPTVGGTTETNTSVPTTTIDVDVEGDELSFTGIGHLFGWELTLGAILMIIGVQLLVARRRQLRRDSIS